MTKGFDLILEDDRLGLRDLDNIRASPLIVDFLAPALQRRVRAGLPKREPLARALGLGAQKPSVFDATGGLGIDAFVMASAGCRVRSIERSEIIYKLLEDGYRRLCESGAEVASRLSFEHGNSINILQTETTGPDIVYLDPMYPVEGHSSALPKKGMQIFRRLIGEDPDIEELIAAARAVARARVVVKRPTSAPVLTGARHSFGGKTARFDVFVI